MSTFLDFSPRLLLHISDMSVAIVTIQAYSVRWHVGCLWSQNKQWNMSRFDPWVRPDKTSYFSQFIITSHKFHIWSLNSATIIDQKWKLVNCYISLVKLCLLKVKTTFPLINTTDSPLVLAKFMNKVEQISTIDILSNANTDKAQLQPITGHNVIQVAQRQLKICKLVKRMVAL